MVGIVGMAELEQALDLVRAHRDQADFVGPRDEGLVAAAEATLNLTFPPTYRRFLLELGAGGFDSEEIFGVIHSDFRHAGALDAVWYTLTERSQSGLPLNLIVIYFLGDGDLFTLDTSSVDAEGECPVVVWLPGG